MARQWRIEFPGALYHVMSRGNGGQDIFHTDDDRTLSLDLLEELSERFNIEVYAYVLMSKHYHLLLKTVEANLSKAMQWFGTTFTRKFNLNNHTNGHLFQGRFKSIIVENDAYLLRLSCYIHRNPLRAGIVDRLADYPWSSYLFYGYKKKAPDWLKTSTILDYLASADPQKAYRKKMQEYAEESQSVWENVKHGLIYGSRDFVEKLKARYLKGEKHTELPQHNSLFREFDPEVMLKKASDVLGLDIEAARNAGKMRDSEKEKRDLLIYLLWKTGRYSNQEIGTLFRLTYSSISRSVKAINTRIFDKQRLKEQYQLLNSHFKV
jgi:REP element-mobilizing transposase RayT